MKECCTVPDHTNWKTCVDRQFPLLADGVIDTTNHETAGLIPAKDVRTVTIFKAGDDTDHYANGVVMTSFKGKLYCMWQSSPKDEDSDDTWVASRLATIRRLAIIIQRQWYGRISYAYAILPIRKMWNVR